MYGVCKVCGCTEKDPCYHPDWGCCWWADDTEELCVECSHHSPIFGTCDLGIEI